MNCTRRKGIPIGLAVLLSGLGAAYAGGVDALPGGEEEVSRDEQGRSTVLPEVWGARLPG
jgi:hypothetical protein